MTSRLPGGEIHVRKQKNREENRGIFEFDLKIVEFCPKSANFALDQGINREFCGYLPNLPSTKQLAPFRVRFKKITGNYQGTATAMDGILPQPSPKRNYATAVAIRRTANDSITRVTPLMSRLMPTSVPITQAELDGHCR